MRVLNYAVLMEVRRGRIKLSSSIFGLVIVVKQTNFELPNFFVCVFFYKTGKVWMEFNISSRWL